MTSGLPFQEQTIRRPGRDVFTQVLSEPPMLFPSRCELAAELRRPRAMAAVVHAVRGELTRQKG